MTKTKTAEAPGAGSRRPVLSRLAAVLVMIAISVAGVLATTTAAHAAPGDDDDKLQGAMSFYSLASSLSSYLSNTLSPNFDGDPRPSDWNAITGRTANAGSMLGYADSNRNDGANWLSSNWTTASATMSYSAFDVEGEDLYGVQDYMHFGATLSALGVDNTQAGMGMGGMAAFAGGGIMWLLYAAASAIDSLFNFALSILSVLNPFQLFYQGINAISPTFAQGMVGGTTETLPAGMAGIADFIGGWYTALVDLSWGVMVPVFLGVLLIGLLMFKSMNKGGAIKKFIIRVAFIGLGLPLIGSMYTGALNSMSSASVDSTTTSSRVVLSTLVDFESWAKTNALAVPDGATIAWDSSKSRPSDDAILNVQDTALAINQQSNTHFKDYYSDESTVKSTDVLDLISRYMSGDTLTASDYETYVKGELTTAIGTDTNMATTVKNWFLGLNGNTKDLNDLTTPLSDETTVGESINGNGIIMVSDGSGLQASKTGNVSTFSSEGFVLCTINAYNVGEPTSCNMPPLALYNYLTTTFNPESYTVYSAENSTSGATREVHTSVNLVGTDVQSILYWMSAVTTLGALVIIGWGYVLALVITSFRRSIQLISAIPFATLGALAGIAKVIVYTFALIVEVFVTIFVYLLVSEFIGSIPDLISSPFQAMMDSSGTSSLPGGAISAIVSLLTVAIMVMFTVMALRLRKSLVKAVEEAVTKLVNKFMDTNAGAPSMGGGKMMPALAGGLAAGAGAAATNKLMNRGGGSGGSKGSGTGGGSSITSAGGTAAAPIGTDGGDAAGADGADGGAGPDGGGEIAVSGEVEETGSSVGAPGSDPSISSDAATVDKGRDVAANGLTDPTAKPGKGDPTQAAGVNQGDVMSGAQASMDASAAKHAEADTAGLRATKEGAEAVGHGVAAVAAGYSGDAATATEQGAKAVQKGASAGATAQEGQQARKDADRSSLDKRDASSEAKAKQLRGTSQTAGQVASAAGSASTTGGAGGASSAAKGASGASGAAKGAKGAGTAVKGASGPKAAPSAPKGGGQARPTPRAQQSQGQAPRQQQAPAQPRQQQAPAPKAQPAPRHAQPRQAPAPKPAPTPRQQQAPAPRSQPAPAQPKQQQAPRQQPQSRQQQAPARPAPQPRPRPAQQGGQQAPRRASQPPHRGASGPKPPRKDGD